MKHIYKCLLMALPLLLTACESITDTFKEFAGDGEIKYLGKCDNLTVSPGWERLIIKWNNTPDPNVAKIKVKWFTDDIADSVLLDKGTEEYNLQNLTDQTYGITVSSLDQDGNESLDNTIYGRPYTAEHEVIQSFTRVISKYYYIGDHLAVYFIGWQEGLESAVLKYTDKDGKADSLIIDQDMADYTQHVLIDKPIDKSKPVTLYRTGKISGCADRIEFAPYMLEEEKNYSADFKEYLKKLYGDDGKIINSGGIVNEDWANKVTTLELDGDFASFDDILNFPHLKTLILGKHRYLTSAGAKDRERGRSKVVDASSSVFAVETMHQLTGLNIERYNKHYRNLDAEWYDTPEWFHEKGMPTMPVTDFMDLSKASVEVSPTDEKGYDSHVNFLFDNDTNTCWLPLTQTSNTDYIFNIDLGNERTVKGLKLVQKSFASTDQDKDLTPSQIKIEVAANQGNYQNATYIDNVYLGTSSGEINLIPFKNGGLPVRYLKVTIPAQSYHGFFQLTFAELGLY